MSYIPRLKKLFNEEILSSLKSDYKSIMQVPKLLKIVINQGIGKGSSDKKLIDSAQREISMFSGQIGMITKSKKDISN